MKMPEQEAADGAAIAIIGGGPGGLSLARLLSENERIGSLGCARSKGSS
jgi:predicted NAD/FAD-binding protein